MTMIADSKKPKTRRKRPQPRQTYYSSDFTPKEFDYYHKSERGEFFVYFIANEKLGALKIGVGNSGRIKQLLNSFAQKDEESEGIGWQVLKVARFSDSSTDYESGKLNANEAEKRECQQERFGKKLGTYSCKRMGYLFTLQQLQACF